jgi:hypothetical protein
MDSDPEEARQQAPEAYWTGAELRPQRPIGREAYRRMLRLAFQGEVLGESAYAVAARLTRVPRQRRKWEVLRQLETQTRECLAQALQREGIPARAALVLQVAGGLVGLLAALAPWRLTMGLLGRAIAVTQRWFARVAQETAVDDPSVFQYLVVHERAQGEFVRRERTGDEAGSLTPILRLLQRSPEQPSSAERQDPDADGPDHSEHAPHLT